MDGQNPNGSLVAKASCRWGMGLVLGAVVYVLTSLVGIRLTLALVVTFGFVWLWNTVVMVGLIVARLAERGLVDKAELEL